MTILLSISIIGVCRYLLDSIYFFTLNLYWWMCQNGILTIMITSRSSFCGFRERFILHMQFLFRSYLYLKSLGNQWLNNFLFNLNLHTYYIYTLILVYLYKYIYTHILIFTYLHLFYKFFRKSWILTYAMSNQFMEPAFFSIFFW